MLDYTALIGRLIADLIRCLPDFAHIRPEQTLVVFTNARQAGLRGTHARLTGLRFEGGAARKTQGGREWFVPKVEWDGVEQLYALTLFLPRFCDLPFEEKLATLCHELYHISPEFDGDLRRLPGRTWQHGASRDAYNDLMRAYARQYLAADPPADLLAPLRLSFAQLCAAYGGVTGRQLRRFGPRPVPPS